MKQLIKVPFMGANDRSCDLIEWAVKSGETVKKGQAIAVVETTKAMIEIEADCGGIIYPISKVGDQLQVSQSIGLISDQFLSDPDADFVLLADTEARSLSLKGPSTLLKITKKAELILQKNNLNPSDVLSELGVQSLNEEIVNKYLLTRTQRSVAKTDGASVCERVGIIGCGGAANLIVDSLLRTPNKRPVALFDRNDALHGTYQMGVQVVGGQDLIKEMLERNELDALVIAFNSDLQERKRQFEKLMSEGVPFTNVIDPSVELRSGVTMGVGNVILGRGYLGTLTSLGDNNFISANVCLEHENILGSHCGFGPGVMSSGHVRMGDCIRFGIGVLMEPFVSIGDYAVVASGCTLRTDVPSNSIVKKTEDHKIR